MNSQSTSIDEASAQKPRTSRRAWAIAALLFWVAIVNYFDRQSLSVLAPQLQDYLHMSNSSYGHVVTGFLFASTIAYALSGILTDRLGTRRSMALFVGWWSAAEALTSIVHSTGALAATRFCLGLGEPGLWVAAPKAIGEWFRKEQRALAIGIYTAGATVGAVIAIPVIHLLLARFPWRGVFLIDGAAGLLWLPVWFLVYRKRTAPYVEVLRAQETAVSRGLREILHSQAMWRLLAARALTDPLWYFYLFWFPKYLFGPRHLSMATLSRVGWLVYLFAGFGTLLGGYASGRLIAKGMLPPRARRAVMIVSAILVPLSPLAGTTPQLSIVIAVAAVAAMAHMSWLINLTAMILDVFPAREVGTVSGLVAAGSGLGGVISTELIAATVMHHGYVPIFWAMAILHPLALAVLWRVPALKQSSRVESPSLVVASVET